MELVARITPAPEEHVCEESQADQSVFRVYSIERGCPPLFLILFTGVSQSPRNFRGFASISVPLVIAIASLVGFALVLIAFIFYRRRLSSDAELLKSAIDGFLKYQVFATDKPVKSPQMQLVFQSTRDFIGEIGKRMLAAESELQTLGRILTNLPTGVIHIDTAGKITKMNLAAASILAVREEKALGKSLGQVVAVVGIDEMVSRARGGEQLKSEFNLFLPSERRISLRLYPLGEVCGEGSEVLCVIDDVTALKRLETIRQEFVGNVSHELRTPLANMTALVGALQSGGIEDGEVAARFLEKLEKEISWMTTMVDDLLTLSRIESELSLPRREKIDLVSMLADAASEKQRLACEYGVSIEIEPYAGPNEFFADPDLVKRSILNLVDNAIRYNQPGGKVSLRACVDEGMLKIFVSDTGIGIPEEDLDRVFERFYRVDEARSKNTGGTGLGLSIVKHAAQVHNGRVEVESREGKGSTFTFAIPYEPAA